MPSAQSIFSDVYFHLANITLSQVFDIGLVSLVYFLVLRLLRHSRATLLLRGALVLVAFFFVVSVFLPLPAFDYLLQLALLGILIATPIIFQPELRRILEELGRRVGTIGFRQMAAETALKPLVRALENLSLRHTGALIVLEGDDDLRDVIDTGVTVGSELTSELLETLFYDGTPLHDGAVVVRGTRVVAAGCVLPVSNRQLYAAHRRLGTRHRAAVGLVERSDALVLVVSEETGQISVAKDGRLESGVDKPALRDRIHNFYQSDAKERESLSMAVVIEEIRDWWRSARELPDARNLASDLRMIVVALLLGVATWAYVIQDLSPTRQERVDNIALRVLDLPPQTALINEPPQEVAAVIKATNEMLATLGPSSFDASVSLADLSPGLHRVPIKVEASVRPVQIVAVEPPELDIQLAPIVTRTVEVRVVTIGENALSPALEIADAPTAMPTQVLVSGAEPQVQSVVAVVAEISVPDTPGAVRRVQQVEPVDGDGNPVRNVEVKPDQVELSLTVARRGNANTVGVRVDTSGSLPDGYRLSRLVASPSQVTLLGDPDRLAEIGGVISTSPVALSQAVADFTVQVPLELPEDVDAIDPDGKSIRSVTVQVGIEERTANVALTREVEVIGSEGVQVALDPATVEVAVYGPVPLLNEIQNQPELLRVVIEMSALSNLQTGESVTIAPRVVAPDGVRTQLVPETVTVTVE